MIFIFQSISCTIVSVDLFHSPFYLGLERISLKETNFVCGSGLDDSLIHSLTHSSRVLKGRWGIKDDRTTTFLHSSLSSDFRKASLNPNPVHSDTLSSHLFFCLPFLLPPCTVPCRIIFASPVDLVMCQHHLHLRFLTVLIRSSYGPIACLNVLELR